MLLSRLTLLMFTSPLLVLADGVGDAKTAQTPTQDGDGPASVLSMLRCLAHPEHAVACLDRRSRHYRARMILEQRASLKAGAVDPPETKRLLEEAQDTFISMLPGFGSTSETSDEAAPQTAGRGHKLKKKIHKIIKLIKIILFIIIVKLKMVFAMFVLQTLFQLKLVFMTFIILLIKKYYLWVEWKLKKEEKKAVVYYEHAQHQHHYDETDHYHDGLGGLIGAHAGHGYHKEEPSPEHGAGWGGWWGKRSVELPVAQAQPLAYSAHAPAAPAAQMPMQATSMLS